MSSKLFSPLKIRDTNLSNRVVISPMCQYSAVDGIPSDWHFLHLGSLSASGAGLLIIEATGVEEIGRITLGCPGLYNNHQEAAFTKIVQVCKKYGGSMIGLQLAHAGRKASTARPWEGAKPLTKSDGAWETIGPSAMPFDEGWHHPKSMNRLDMDRVCDAFVKSTERCIRMGIDLIEIHMAHGYLLSQFLSPIANQRNDEYGGSIENRVRFPLEVFTAVRSAWPDHKGLGARISATDWEEHGWTSDDSVFFANSLKEQDCDFIVCSSGGNISTRPPVANLGQGYQVPLASKVKTETGMTTMAVGMIRDPQYAEELISAKKADLVAIARGFLYEPGWTHRAAEELGGQIFYPNQYKRAMPENWSRAFPNRQKNAAE